MGENENKSSRKNIALFMGLLENEYSCAVLQGAAMGAREVDANLLVFPMGLIDGKLFIESIENEYKYQYNTLDEFLKSQSIDAAVVEYATITSHIAWERKKDLLNKIGTIPTILLSETAEGYHSMCVDNETGLKEIIFHLIEQHGCKKIGFVSGPETNEEAMLRCQVFRDTLKERGLFLGEDWIAYGNFSIYCTDVIQDLIERHPDIEAIVFANDHMAEAGYQVMEGMGLVPGKDILVTGFDDIASAGLMNPPLTTVRANTSMLAYHAVLSVAQGDNFNKAPLEQKLATHMVQRKSCGCTGIAENDQTADNSAEIAQSIFAQMFRVSEDTNQTRQYRQLLEDYVQLFFDMIDADGKVLFEYEKIYDGFSSLAEALSQEYIGLSDFLAINHAVFTSVQGNIADEKDRLYLQQELAGVNQDFLADYMKQKALDGDTRETLEVELSNIAREMVQYLASEKDRIKAVLNVLKKMRFNAGYVFLYENYISHKRNEQWKGREEIILKGFFNGENENYFEGNNFIAKVSDLFHGEYLPKQRRYDLLILPLFFGEKQYGFLMGESDIRDYRLALQLANQVSSTMEILYSMEKQEEVQKELAFANQSKSQFLANMSHEIRTPINAILGMNEMVLRENDDADINSYAIDIQNAGKNLLSIVNNILDFSKIESGKMELLYEEYDFSGLLHDITNMISIRAEQKDLVINLNLDETLPTELYGDSLRVQQILLNLLTNAVKYTEKGSVTFSVSGSRVKDNHAEEYEKAIKIFNEQIPEEYLQKENLQKEKEAGKEQDSGDGYIDLYFEVKDTGIGIKEEDLSKLFEKFERIEEKRNRNIEGTGLGMNITLSFLAMMGSSLKVESVYGEGSKFSFHLIQKIISDEPVGNLEQRIRDQKKEYQYHKKFTAADAKILIVDDNDINRRVFKNLLKTTKMQFTEASDGLGCLEQVEKDTYDIIFLDHMMPGLDGMETLERLKNNPAFMAKNTPVIALTANAIFGAKEIYINHGFTDYLTKPILSDKLEELLLKYLPPEKVKFEEQHVIAENNTKETDKRLESLADIPDLNLEYARIFTKDPEFLLEIIEGFYRSMKSDADTLYGYFQKMSGSGEAADQQENMNQYRIKVHSMKSTAAMAGAVSLSGVARMLENAAAREDMGAVLRMTEGFLKEWENLRQMFSKVFTDKEEDNAGKRRISKEELEEELQKLIGAMEEMDVDTADEIVKNLKTAAFTGPAKEELDRLGLAVEKLDEDAVKISAENLLRKFAEAPEDNADNEPSGQDFGKETQSEDAAGNREEDSDDSSKKIRILVVDDNETNQITAKKILEKKYHVSLASGGSEALEELDKKIANDMPVDLILLDLRMPDMDGFTVMKRLREKETTKAIPVIFLTADNNRESEIKGFELGALDFITKPFVPGIMMRRVERILELDHLQKHLETEVKHQTEVSERRREKVERLTLQAMTAMAAAIDAKDHYTNGHSSRVAKYSKMIAERLGKSEKEQEDIYYIGLLHDIGKIGIPDDIINKPRKLNDEEFAVIKTHPAIGAKILSRIDEIPNVEIGAHWHHERYDGTGYPDGLKGKDIPETARIIGVADAYDAMTSNRSYRSIMPQEKVRKEILAGKGKQFDPEFADVMLQIIDEDKQYELHE